MRIILLIGLGISFSALVINQSKATGMQASPSLLPLSAVAAAEPAGSDNAAPYASPGMEQYLAREGVGEADLLPSMDNASSEPMPTPSAAPLPSPQADYVTVPTAPPVNVSLAPLEANGSTMPPLMPSEAGSVSPAAPQSYRVGNFSFHR